MFDAAAPAPRAGVTTPGWLRCAMAAISLLAVLAFCVSLWAAASIRETAQTIGQDAEPSVALALRMAATLSDMNAAALADSLTDNGAATGTSLRFRQDELDLSSDFVAAARNITYGEAEAAPLRALQRWMLAYQEAIAEARTAGAGDAWLTARRVQWASRVNRDFAAPEAEALAQANAAVLEAEYARYRSSSPLRGGAAFLAFALLVLALVVVQVWLARRVRRIVNPLLAGATAVAALAGLWFGLATLGERADLRAAKADAYDSLRVLFEAKGAAAALRADTSMWLLDPSTRADSQARMDASVRALAGTDLDDDRRLRELRGRLAQALSAERAGQVGQALAVAPHLGGLLGTELDNVTFGMAERQPATDSFDRLLDARTLIRAVQGQATQEEQRSRRHAVTAQRWLSDAPGGGGAAFAALQGALDRTLAVNQSEFDRRVDSALGTARLMPFVTACALLATVLLAMGGLWQRLREYR